jgi:hypothetical protein
VAVACYFKVKQLLNGDTKWSAWLKNLAPPSPPPAPVPGGHSYSYFNSALNSGNDLPGTYGTYNLQEAEDKCSGIPNCAGFTFKGNKPVPDASVPFWFKSSADMNGATDWSAYIRDITPAIPTPRPMPTPKPSPPPPQFPYDSGDVFVAVDCDANDPSQMWNKNHTGEKWHNKPLMSFSLAAATRENMAEGGYSERWSQCIDCGQCAEGVQPHVWPCKAPFNDNQKWISNGTHGFLQHEGNSELCLTVINTTLRSSPVVVAQCDPSQNQVGGTQFWEFPFDAGAVRYFLSPSSLAS